MGVAADAAVPIIVGASNGATSSIVAAIVCVTIGVAITCGSELWSILVWLKDAHLVDEILGVSEIWIWVALAEVWKNLAPHQILNAKNLTENLSGIWSSDAMHSVEAHREIFSSQKFFDLVEIEQRLH